jgi:2-dehydro-3-deoxygluconokinase
MLRFDPGEGRVRNSRSFAVWEGGGEYNVARGLRRCFGQRTAALTAIPRNDIGLLLEDLMLQGGVDMRYVKWVDYDGIGLSNRVGLNFTERGFGVRGALGVSDRGHTAAAALSPGDFDFSRIFKEDGARWFHCGGIFAALGDRTAELAIEAMRTAHEAGTIVSYDLNYRPSLWGFRGGEAAAQEANREIAKYVDVMIGNEEDFTACLGYEVEGTGDNLTALDPARFESMIARVKGDYPNFKAIATTLRGVHTASSNDWSAVLWYDGEFYRATKRPELDILDRVGGGDSFASGLVYGFLAGLSPQECVEYGAAHGALAMTTAGDTSTATLSEVQRLVGGGGARVVR